MTGIIVVFPRAEDARGIKNLLVKSGFSVHAVCTTGAQAINSLENLNSGIVICGYKMADMMYSELQECLPEGVGLLLLATGRHLAECDTRNLRSLPMPLKVNEFLGTVGEMVAACEYRRRLQKNKPREKKPEEMAVIAEAKKLLMEKKSMTEMAAHKYLQKNSMDSGTTITETARKVLVMLGEGME